MLGKISRSVIMLAFVLAVFSSEVCYPASNTAQYCDSEFCMSVKKPKGWMEFSGATGFSFFYEKTGTSNSFDFEKNNGLSESEFRRQILDSVKKYFKDAEFVYDKEHDTYTIEKDVNYSVVRFFNDIKRAFIYESKTNRDLPPEDQLAKDKKFMDGIKAIGSLNIYKKKANEAQIQKPRQASSQQQKSRPLNPMEQLLVGTFTEALTGKKCIRHSIDVCLFKMWRQWSIPVFCANPSDERM